MNGSWNDVSQLPDGDGARAPRRSTSGAHRCAAWIAVTLATLVSCRGDWLLPDTGVDVELGAESAAAVEAEMGIVSHAESQALVEAIGRKLVAALEKPTFEYRFAVVDQPESNAFALPGGHIYVSRGLLSLVVSEAELAGVIAHEIQHVERRHSVKRMQKSRRLGVLSLPGRAAAGIISDDLARLVGAPFELVAAGYSRDQETESDVLGQALCARAGYEPAALARILDRMEVFESIGSEEKRRASFFDSHPTTDDRVARLTRDGRALTVAEGAAICANEGELFARLAGLSIGEDPRHGFVRGSAFLHPTFDLYLEFPKDWRVENSPSSVTAVAPNQRGVVVLGVVGEGEPADLATHAEQCAKELEKEYGVKPEERRATTTGGVPAHALIVTDASGEEPTHIYFLWIAYDGIIFQVIGLSTAAQRPLLRAAIDSIRPLTRDELASTHRRSLEVVTATASETLADLGVRTENSWSTQATAVANGLDAALPLREGQPIKIARTRSLSDP